MVRLSTIIQRSESGNPKRAIKKYLKLSAEFTIGVDAVVCKRDITSE